jgi:hypothetical protein
MKSLTISNFQASYINLTLIYLLEELLFINLFYLFPKGCKLMKINTSFRIRGEKRNFFLHPFAIKNFYRTIVILNS